LSLPSKSPNPKPDSVTDLEAVYGAPSQAGFGSAVFYEVLEPGTDLEAVALRYYRYFVGDLWERFGEAAWMAPWKLVYTRQPGGKPNIVAELQAIADLGARLSVPMLLETDDTERGKKALSVTYDDADVNNLAVYSLGDGEAMSGLLVAGQRRTGEATFLVFLLD
jgi:hypothetical protein